MKIQQLLIKEYFLLQKNLQDLKISNSSDERQDRVLEEIDYIWSQLNQDSKNNIEQVEKIISNALTSESIHI
jgi:hypothetical protein